MRRRVDLRWRIRPEEIQRLRGVQLELLGQAAALLRPGGSLVYSTCSLEPEENQDVVDEFLAAIPASRWNRSANCSPLPMRLMAPTSPGCRAPERSPPARLFPDPADQDLPLEVDLETADPAAAARLAAILARGLSQRSEAGNHNDDNCERLGFHISWASGAECPSRPVRPSTRSNPPPAVCFP